MTILRILSVDCLNTFYFLDQKFPEDPTHQSDESDKGTVDASLIREDSVPAELQQVSRLILHGCIKRSLFLP